MAEQNKYSAPSGAPPSYPQQTHQDAGPYYPPNPTGSPAPNPYNQMQPSGYYNGAPQQYEQYQYQNQNQYGPPQGWQQQGAPPQGGYYGVQPGGMYYQQQQMPPQGYYGGQSRGASAGEGICAGLLGALACCCCLDCLI